MNEIKCKETGAIFDDWVKRNVHGDPEEEHWDTTHWTQVCDGCTRSLHLLDSYLSLNEGHGICGVKGCENEADHYYDFNPEEL